MHFMLTLCIKVEVVNRVAYMAGLVSIKMSVNIIPPNWHSHNDKNANADVLLAFTMVTIKWLLFQLPTDSWEIWSLCATGPWQIGITRKINLIKCRCLRWGPSHVSATPCKLFLSCKGHVYTLRLITVLHLRLVKPYTLRLIKVMSKVCTRCRPSASD